MDDFHFKNNAKLLRQIRILHRFTGISLFVFFFVVAVTSILLGWKKNSYGYIQANTEIGISSDARQWKPMNHLIQIAQKTMQNAMFGADNSKIDKIDINSDKGVVKFTFKNHYWGLQIDATSGAVLKKEWRTSDFIEHLYRLYIQYSPISSYTSLDYLYNYSGINHCKIIKQFGLFYNYNWYYTMEVY